jgi:selenophosphate synthase
VWAHIGVGGEYLTLINKLKLRTADRSKSYAIWDVTAEHDIISTSDVLDPVIWNEYDDGVIRTMFPLDI